MSIRRYACAEMIEIILWFRLQMSRIVAENAPDSAEAYYRPASLELRKNLGALEAFNKEINQILSPVQLSSPLDKLTSKVDQKAEIENLSSLSTPLTDNTILGVETMDTDNPIKINQAETNPEREINNLPGNITGAQSFSDGPVDIEMEEKQEDTSEKSGPQVIT